MDRLKRFVSSIWSFVCLVSVVGSGIIVVAVLMTSTANAVTITGLAPNPLYLLHETSGELILTMSGTADIGGLVVSLAVNNFIISVPENVTVPAFQNTATFTVTSGSTVGDAWVMASYMASSASARIIITADNPPVPIPSAVWLLGSGLVGLVGLRRKFKKA